MGAGFSEEHGELVWRCESEEVRVQGWGADSFRVRMRRAGNRIVPGPQALINSDTPAELTHGPSGATVTNGRLLAEVSPEGWFTFTDVESGKVLLQEKPRSRVLRHASGGLDRAELAFQPAEEKLFGLGQHQHGRLDQKGCVIDLAQRNTEVAIPFLLSSKGYGFLWNNPGIGRVELGHNGTRWVAEATWGIDFWITAAETPAGVLANYTEATGRPPQFPSWAAGFWQSKLRYASQKELLSVAREYHRRGLLLDVIVVDYFHWPAMGDWKFDLNAWPDPASMVRELESMGIKLMVSVWPTVNAASENFNEMSSRGLLVQTERGVGALTRFVDTRSDDPVYVHHYDATNPEARDYVWEKIRRGYHEFGIQIFWLDACEPEMIPADHANVRYFAGNGLAVGCYYPLANQQTFFDGLTAAGEREIVTLCRSAWAGSQRFGAALWSGDIPSTFEALRAQLRAGLNAALSGISWWTTDIGGFHGGDNDSPAFRELIVRWFQYGVFCPLFRLHGVRDPSSAKSGGPNEIWSFGKPAETIIISLLALRHRMKPYMLQQMKQAQHEGVPPMRPLFFDFPNDANAWKIEDQFFFGPDLLIAPVLEAGSTARHVYLPAGCDWSFRDERYEGGGFVEVEVPLDVVPVFTRRGADVSFLRAESIGGTNGQTKASSPTALSASPSKARFNDTTSN